MKIITIIALVVLSILLLFFLLLVLHDLLGNFSKEDKEWRRKKESNDWKLPQKGRGGWFVRLPGVRRLRYAYLSTKIDEKRIRGSLLLINPRDAWILYAVFRGWY